VWFDRLTTNGGVWFDKLTVSGWREFSTRGVGHETILGLHRSLC
jgi:hypothetical protein